MQERRRSARVRSYLPVRLTPQGGRPVIETLTKDVGLGGVKCLSPVSLPVSSVVSLELTLGFGDEPLQALAKTSWFQIIPQSDQFCVGLSFQDLSEETTQRLSRYLDQTSLQPTQAVL